MSIDVTIEAVYEKLSIIPQETMKPGKYRCSAFQFDVYYANTKFAKSNPGAAPLRITISRYGPT